MSGRGTIISARALFAGVALLALAACDRTLREGVDTGIASGKARAEAQAARLDAAQRGQVIVEESPYYGRKVEAKTGSRQGKPLPKKLEGAKGIDIAIDGKADIRTIAAAIEAATDIPVSVRTRYVVGDGQVIEVPIGTRMTARHEGPLSAFLDRIAARMDVAWHYDGRAIAIERMTTRQWKVPLPRGKTTVSDTITGEPTGFNRNAQAVSAPELSMMSIDRIVSALASSEKRPDAAVRAALAEPDAVVERTIDIMERLVAAGDAYREAVTDDECQALGILVLVCAELRNPRAHRPLLRLLADDQPRMVSIFADMITTSMPGILIATFDGSPRALTGLMEDPAADEFCRNSAFRAWTYLAAVQAWPKAETERWLRTAFDTLQPQRDSYVWVSWLIAVAVLGLDQLVPLAERAYAEERIGDDNIFAGLHPFLREEFDDVLRHSQETTDLHAFLRDEDLQPLSDTITEISRWHWPDDHRLTQSRQERENVMAGAAINENRRIGRNDPCPCGSGRKYKKCCLDA